MFRNEKTGRFESEKSDVPAYGYYSKVLNKPFDTVEELCKAEDEFKLAEKKKQEELEVKCAEASKVEKAIDAYEEGKVVCDNAIAEAYKEYKEKVTKAEKELTALQEVADKELNAFLETHPNGFHYTYRSKDGKVTRTYNYLNKRFDVFDNYNNFLKAIDNLWFR